MSAIPIIDISPLVRLGKRRDSDENEKPDVASVGSVVDQISHACRTVGFFAVTNHGVGDGVISSAWDASEGFFDSDPTVKTSCPMHKDYPYGYESHESLGTELAASSLRPDSKETFSIGPRDSEVSGMPPRRWPRDVSPSFEKALTRYFDVMEDLASVLFLGFAMALRLDDESWFLQEGRFDAGHQCALRILNYPPLHYDEGEGPKKVHIRAGAHTDYGAMTILRSGGPGLQLRLSSGAMNGATGADDDAAWVDVPYLPDAFIINLGDLMQRWTNDRWKSTLHRVIAVPDGGDGSDKSEEQTRGAFESGRRQSIAFFVNMNGNATIVPFGSCVNEARPSRYAPVKASDYLVHRHAQSMGNAK